MRSALRTRIALTLATFATFGALAVGVVALLLPAWSAPLVAAVRGSDRRGLGWFVGRMAARSFVAPLERLGATAASFAAGSHSVRAQIEGPRETRIIAESFNQMASQVDSRHRRTQGRGAAQDPVRLGREPRAPHAADGHPGRRRDAARRRRRTRRPAAVPLDHRAGGRAARHGSPTTCSRSSASRGPPASSR